MRPSAFRFVYFVALLTSIPGCAFLADTPYHDGIVVDARTGAPLSEIRIRLYDGAAVLPSSHGATDAAGRFHLPAGPPPQQLVFNDGSAPGHDPRYGSFVAHVSTEGGQFREPVALEPVP